MFETEEVVRDEGKVEREGEGEEREERGMRERGVKKKEKMFDSRTSRRWKRIFLSK